MTTEVLSPPSDVPSKFSIYHAITLKIVRAISEQKGKYEMPWHSSGTPLSVPLNAASNQTYRGVNILALWAESMIRGYTSPLWAGYKQWQSLGAQVQQGHRGTLVVFYRRVDPADEERAIGLFPRYISRAYWVFNACQVENFSPPDVPERTPVEVHDDVDAFVRATEAQIFRDPARAYYAPSSDGIYMPAPAMFIGSSTRNATEAYYAVLLHELTHWTGAKHRLDREFGLRFGDKAYAFEELVAELGAAFMCSAFGITNEPRPDHAAYVATWLEVLSNDSKAIFAAASRAQEAIQFLGELAASRVDLEPAEMPKPKDSD